MRTLLTMGECRLLLFLAISQVLQNLWHFEMADCRVKWMIDRRAKGKLWHFEILINTGPYAAGNFKVLFLPQFSLEPVYTLYHWSPSTLYDNIGYHDKSKCLLEYCNEKLASSKYLR